MASMPLLKAMLRVLNDIPLFIYVLLCLTLGLAPFVPQPHLWQKLVMLTSGTLTRPIDIFDFFLHVSPFLLLILKLVLMKKGRRI